VHATSGDMATPEGPGWAVDGSSPLGAETEGPCRAAIGAEAPEADVVAGGDLPGEVCSPDVLPGADPGEDGPGQKSSSCSAPGEHPLPDVAPVFGEKFCSCGPSTRSLATSDG